MRRGTTHFDMKLIDIYNDTYKTLRGRKAANTRAINYLTKEITELKTDMKTGREYHLGEPIFMAICKLERDLDDEKVVKIKLNK